MAEVIRGCQANQQLFDTVEIPSNPPRYDVIFIVIYKLYPEMSSESNIKARMRIKLIADTHEYTEVLLVYVLLVL